MLRISNERFAKGLRMVSEIRPIFLFLRMLSEGAFTKDLRMILDMIAKLCSRVIYGGYTVSLRMGHDANKTYMRRKCE
eukprot:jgi/Botrbrau1/23582/Bobra.0141s0046.1